MGKLVPDINSIKEIYENFDAIGCLSFTTVNEACEPVARIAHLRGFDEDGIYFMTMFTKDFYKHLIANPRIAISGLCADTKVSHDEGGAPVFAGGYAIRMTGTVKQVSNDELVRKNNPIFDFCIKDQEKYKAMVVMCICSGRGDIFDYDFAKVNRDTKMERTYFAFNGESPHYKGLRIDQDRCTSCGICRAKCSFSAISVQDKLYTVNENRCDECGDCLVNCPSDAILH